MTALDQLAAEYADRPDVLVEIESDDLRWSGYASLIPLLIPIESVEAHPRNPRKGNLDVIARSLSDYGQTKPIVVQASTRWIVAGNHTRRAALEKAGWTHIAAVVAEISEDDATGYLLADNRSSDLGEYDTTGLIELLGEAAEAGRIAMTGYSADDLDDLIAENDRVASEASGEFRAGYEEEELAQPRLDKRVNDGLFEVVLLLPEENRQNFVNWIKMLKREWSAETTSDAVIRAVREAAERL